MKTYETYLEYSSSLEYEMVALGANTDSIGGSGLQVCFSNKPSKNRNNQ
ncbi:hypothetical protein [Helicobacter sp. 11S02596-1]|nr:hypothetical protein [Helicobacter sp. 11S02596-1]